MAKTLAEMTPEERDAAIRKAFRQLEEELTRNADKIAEVLDNDHS